MFPRVQGIPRAPPTGYPTATTNVTSAHHNIHTSTQYQQCLQQPGYQDAGSANYNGQNGQNALMCMVQQIQQTNTVLLSRLSSIESNVSRLGKIEQDVSLVRSEISVLKLDNISHVSLNSKCVDLENSCQFISNKYDTYAETEKKHSEKLQALRSENSLLWRAIDKSKENYQKAQDEIQELKARSMQENLLFFGLCEGTYNEDTEFKLRQFLSNELDLESNSSVENIVFDRVHRIGRRRGDGIRYPRPIMAKFERYRDREMI